MVVGSGSPWEEILASSDHLHWCDVGSETCRHCTSIDVVLIGIIRKLHYKLCRSIYIPCTKRRPKNLCHKLRLHKGEMLKGLDVSAVERERA